MEEIARLAANMVKRDLSKSGQIGKEDKKVFTYDGDMTGKEIVVFDGNLYAKVANTPTDLSSVKTVTVVFSDGVEEIPTEDLFHYSEENGQAIAFDETKDPMLALSFSAPIENTDFTVGVWLLAQETLEAGGAYVSRIETETIHPIDPKYLPGVCLPVVELETVPTDEDVKLTDAEQAAMTAVWEKGTPVVVKTKMGEYEVCLVCFRMSVDAGDMGVIKTFIGAFPDIFKFSVVNEGSGWYTRLE